MWAMVPTKATVEAEAADPPPPIGKEMRMRQPFYDKLKTIDLGAFSPFIARYPWPGIFSSAVVDRPLHMVTTLSGGKATQF